MNGMKDAVEQTVKAKYLERIEEYIKDAEDKMGDTQKVITQNELIKDIVVASGADDPLVKESIDGFEQIIKMNKDINIRLNVKREAAITLRNLIESNEKISTLEIMVNFDKMVG